MTKVKLGIIGVIVVAGVAMPLAIQNHSQARLRNENEALRQTLPGQAKGFSAKDIDFELSGNSTHESFNLNGSRAAVVSSRFTVQKSGEKWSLVNSPGGLLTTEAVMFDGADVYTLTRNIPVPERVVSTLPEQALKYEEGRYYGKASTAIIFSGEVPLGAAAVSRLLWEAYLAERVLKTRSTVCTPAPWDSAYRPEAASFTRKIQWPQPDAQFPAIITFIASSQLWDESGRQLDHFTDISPYDDGVTAGIYRVNEWTNLHDGASQVLVPARFELSRYFPAKYQPSSPALAERVQCQVTNLVLGTRAIPPLKLDDEVNVLDYRFRNSTLPWFYVVYAITNKAWKSTNDSLVRDLIGPAKTRHSK
jgi:hypothetical protein